MTNSLMVGSAGVHRLILISSRLIRKGLGRRRPRRDLGRHSTRYRCDAGAHPHDDDGRYSRRICREEVFRFSFLLIPAILGDFMAKGRWRN